MSIAASLLKQKRLDARAQLDFRRTEKDRKSGLTQ
jgi:hypothetical protein